MSQSILALCLASLISSSSAFAQSPLTGWPYTLGETSSIFAPPTFADVTGDGLIEVVSVVGSPLQMGTTTEGAYAFRSNGAELLDGDGNPSTQGVFRAFDFGASHSRLPVTMGELDDLPGDELLFFSGNTVQAIKGNGTNVSGWPLHFSTSTEAYSSATIVVADVDRDSRDDVIFTSGYDPVGLSSKLHVVDRHGVPLPGWPVTLPRDSFGVYVHNIVAGNFDDDDELEVVISSTPTSPASLRKVVMLDHRGGRVWSRSIAAHDMVAADLDGDGKLELIVLEVPRVVNNTWVVNLFVLTGEGKRRSHFSVALGPYIDQVYTDTIAGIPNVMVTRESRAYTGAHPYNEHYPDVLFLGHVDDGPSLEAVFSVRYFDVEFYGQMVEVQWPTIFANWGATFAIDLQTMTTLPGYPVHHPYVVGSLASPTDRYISADRLIDIDGDGRQEIVTTEHEVLASGADEVTLRVWNSVGAQVLEHDVRAWTPSTGLVLEPTLRRLSFGDVDQDGLLDFGINMRRGELHIEGLQVPIATGPQLYGSWPVARQNTRRTGVLQ